MANRDQATEIDIVASVSPDSISSDPVNGAGVDTRGADSVTIDVKFGTVDAGIVSFKVQDSPDDSVWSDVTPVQKPAVGGVLYGDAYASAVVDNEHRKLAYVGSVRFVRVVIEGADTATKVKADVILGRLAEQANLNGMATVT